MTKVSHGAASENVDTMFASYADDMLLLLQAIHSVAWHHEGKQFVCSHSDGTLTTWNIRAPAKAAQIITPHGTSCCAHKHTHSYGPFTHLDKHHVVSFYKEKRM